MQLTAVLQLALAILPLIQTGVPQFISFIETIKSELQRTGEWTDAQDQAYRSALFAKTQDPAYQMDTPPQAS